MFDTEESRLLGYLSDQEWRLNNLYTIQNEKGEVVPFRMNPVQQAFYPTIHNFNVILKSRQVGYSTFIQIYALDSCLFNSSHTVGIVAHTHSVALRLFRDKIRFVYDNLPDWIKRRVQATRLSSQSLELSNGSSITVGTPQAIRGGTFQKLHISEFGKVAAEWPGKAEEIVTGAMNTVHAGQQIFVESTAQGTSGMFYDLCEKARELERRGFPLLEMQPRFHFTPWFADPRCTATGEPAEDSELAAYLDRFSLSKGQRSWYVQKREMMGELVLREFPSTPDEAFQGSTKGSYYAPELAYLRKNKQIGRFAYDPRYPVRTYWDLGGTDQMAIWFFQDLPGQPTMIRYSEEAGKGWDWWARHLNSFPYNYPKDQCIWWPHDGAHRVLHKDGFISSKDHFQQIAPQFGVIQIVPRTTDVHWDILSVCKPNLMRCYFDEEHCRLGLERLDSYQKEWDTRNAIYRDKPRHDISSNGADAFRTFAVGFLGSSAINNGGTPRYEQRTYGIG